jgi:hypothetical protein
MEAAARRTALQAAGLVLAGAVAGGVLASEVTASAASGSGSTQASPYAYGAAPAPGGYGGPGGPGVPGGLGGPRGHGFGLALSGTVTAVGGSSVTIKTTSGTKTYAVDAQSDIDRTARRSCPTSNPATACGSRCVPAPRRSPCSMPVTRRRTDPPAPVRATAMTAPVRG